MSRLDEAEYYVLDHVWHRWRRDIDQGKGDTSGADWDQLVETAKGAGMDEEVVEEALNALLDRGLVNEPILAKLAIADAGPVRDMLREYEEEHNVTRKDQEVEPKYTSLLAYGPWVDDAPIEAKYRWELREKAGDERPYQLAKATHLAEDLEVNTYVDREDADEQFWRAMREDKWTQYALHEAFLEGEGA